MPTSKKRRAKKYRPRPVVPGPLICAAAVDNTVMPDAVRSELVLSAERSLSAIFLGTYERKHYVRIFKILTNLYVLAKVFEECETLRLQALVAILSLVTMDEYQQAEAGRDSYFSDKPISFSRQEYLALFDVVDTAVRTFIAMADKCEMPLLIQSEAAALRWRLRPNDYLIAVVTPELGEHDPLGLKGAAWIHGEIRPGYLDLIDGVRLAWRMPLTNTFAVIDKPTVIAYIPEKKHA